MSGIVERLRTATEYGYMPHQMRETANEAADTITDLLAALEVLLEEAENFSVSGVYFDEACMGHKGPELARDAIAKAKGETT